MEYDGKEQSPYRGCAVMIACLVLVPVIVYLVLRAVIVANTTHPRELNEAMSLAFGFGVGSLFHVSCFIAGAFGNAFSVVKKRMIDFKENLFLSFGFAFKSYLRDMKENGFLFIIYLVIMLVCLFLAVRGLTLSLALLGG